MEVCEDDQDVYNVDDDQDLDDGDDYNHACVGSFHGGFKQSNIIII